jgi:ubiquinone/menaquinone biosynthesis C-methylase UbiE
MRSPDQFPGTLQTATVNNASDAPRDAWPASPGGYLGGVAEQYEAVRAQQRAWHREHQLVEHWCATVAPRSTLLDIPCGTGRLLPICQQYGLRVVGADLSADMMRRIPSGRLALDSCGGLAACDAAQLPFPDGSFDYVVSLRLFHLEIDLQIQKRMLREFLRVARRGLLLHVVMTGRPPYERAADLALRAFRLRRQLPGRLMRKLTRGAGRTRGDSRTIVRRWPYVDLHAAVQDAGFVVRRMDGAATPFSAKKLCVIERTSARS